ncbi:MAG: signal peptidase I [bacterium]
MSNPKTRQKSALREYAEAILVALVLAFFIRSFIIQAFKIPSGSMIPTLLIGDHILVNKFIFGPEVPLTHFRVFSYKKPQRGDVVVFLEPVERKRDFIKRVIGLPGETLQVIQRKVYINGAPLDESGYAYFDSVPATSLDNFGPYEIPEDSYFMMGDNRENSSDSRVWGSVPFELIKGEAVLIYWSWDSNDHSLRWSRIGDIIH